MSGKRVAGVVVLLVAALAGAAGVSTLSQGVAVDDRSGLGVSRAVGAFLPALVLLIIGLWLFQKPGPKRA